MLETAIECCNSVSVVKTQVLGLKRDFPQTEQLLFCPSAQLELLSRNSRNKI